MTSGLTRQEQLLSRLIEEYSLDFSERLTLKTAQDFIYLSDIETYELYLISTSDEGELPPQWRGYAGRKCYEVLQNRTDPCPFCTNSRLVRDQYYIWQHYNPIAGRNYILKDKLVDYKGRQVRMEVVIDVSTSSRVYKVLQNSIESQNVLAACLEPLVAENDPGTAFLKLLGHIGRFFGAEWGFIHDFTGDTRLTLWAQDGRAHRALVEQPSPAALADWGARLAPGRQVLMRDGDGEKLSPSPAERRLLEQRGIRSLCITPIFIGARLAGFLVLDNIRRHWPELSVLNTLCSYLSSLIQKEELLAENDRLQYYDPLTGRLNFEGFKRRARQLLEGRGGRGYAVWYGDIKRFKYINDAFGYDAGDRLLRHWAGLLTAEEREGDEVFCRVSADNFVALRRCDGEEDLYPRFERMARELGAFPELARRRFMPELAAGVYLVGDNAEGLSLEEMINRANMAQKSVKDGRGSRLALYDEALRSRVLREMELDGRLHAALQHREFELYLQPQVPASPEARRGPLRAEALVRWRDPDGRMIQPGEFIPLFERSGKIAQVDLYMLQEACRFLVKARQALGRPLCVAVNVSRISMLRPGFVEDYRRVRDAWGVPAGALELEFTESIAVENFEPFREAVTALRQSGFLCAMDDFGTGQSSLNCLQNLPLDVLKLDQAFFLSASDPGRRDTVVASVLAMARRLSMRTVAEGVESAGEARLLQEMGCDYIQGYVYSRPVPAEQYLQQVQEALDGGAAPSPGQG